MKNPSLSRILGQTRFTEPEDGWVWPACTLPDLRVTGDGVVLDGGGDDPVELRGLGVHTRNGDSIELRFQVLESTGQLFFGFDADRHEHARIEINFSNESISFATSDWTLHQPIASLRRPITPNTPHTLVIEKEQGSGNLIKNADVAVYLDGNKIISLMEQNLLPEMGVTIQASGTSVLLKEFVHRGVPSGIPEFLHLGGWQMLNVDSIEDNLRSLFRGLRLASEQRVELLVTPEASLTGLSPTSPTTTDPGPIAEAEVALRRFISELPNAPYVVVGFPVWRPEASHDLDQTRYIGSRVYDPDGEVVYTGTKVHSAEQEVWHGYGLNEFDVKGVPVSMHICHDHRYPELQTLPVVFGCRLVLHPSNGGKAGGTIRGLEEIAKSNTTTTHVFYLNVNGGGGSYIAGPRTKGELITVSEESCRDSPSFPLVGEPVECLFHSRIRVHDAFGYWPTRSFRASEAVARSYVNLYRALGGSRKPN